MITYDQFQYCKHLIGEALASVDNEERFRRAFAETRFYMDWDDNFIATELQVSRPTIGRWAKGVTCPHMVAREPVLKWLLGRLNSANTKT